MARIKSCGSDGVEGEGDMTERGDDKLRESDAHTHSLSSPPPPLTLASLPFIHPSLPPPPQSIQPPSRASLREAGRKEHNLNWNKKLGDGYASISLEVGWLHACRKHLRVICLSSLPANGLDPCSASGGQGSPDHQHSILL